MFGGLPRNPPTGLWAESPGGDICASLGGLGDVVLPSPFPPPPRRMLQNVTACVEWAGPSGVLGWVDGCAAPRSLLLVRSQGHPP